MVCLLSANFVTKALNSKENLKKSSSVICFIDFMFRVLSSHLLLQKKFFYKIAKNFYNNYPEKWNSSQILILHKRIVPDIDGLYTKTKHAHNRQKWATQLSSKPAAHSK